MNQRIRELAEQAGFTEWHRMDNPNGDAVIQTFAELLVRECANLPFKSTGEVTTIGEIAVSNMILKHFGVE